MSRAGFSKKVRKYTPKCRKSEANPPIFDIRRLSPPELLDIAERVSDKDEVIELGGVAPETAENKSFKISLKTLNKFTKSKYAILDVALSGWENVEDEDGQPIPFNKESISCLDTDLVDELSDVAQGVIGAEEAKNSESPS